MTFQRQNIHLIGRAVADNLRYWAGGRWRRCRPTPDSACRVPPDFFGICVASAPDPACDDYVIARLKELDISRVRLDFTYDSRDAYGERFLKRLLDASFGVCLHLVQPPADVRTLDNSQTQERWRTFVAETIEAYAPRLDMVEIGSTCNRRQWSGYTLASFLLSWQIAWEEAQRHGVRLAAPNVTDFEPFYNVAILSELKRGGMLPALHTDNLFVERATEPEAFDHKILGRRLAGLLRFTLVRKAQVLRDIGLWAGVPETLCSHVAWSLRRIARLLDHVEEKQADYVARYACLAAASGALRRLYWGPLIGQREGLIDDGTSDYPDIPHVTYYGHVRGRIAGYRRRPAFYALQTVSRFLSGSEFLRKIPTGPGLEILEFIQVRNAPAGNALHSDADRDGEPAFAQAAAAGQLRNSRIPGSVTFMNSVTKFPHRIIHMAWTTNGNAAEAAACYTSDILKAAEAYSRDGVKLDKPLILFTESPVYLVWPSPFRESSAVSGQPSAINGIIPGVRFASLPGKTFAPFRRQEWMGFYLAEDSGRTLDLAPLLDMVLNPGEAGPVTGRMLPRSAMILRDSRNRVWSVPSPGDRIHRWVIKQFKPRGFWRRLIQRRQPDRAQRSWNGAQELLRRGIPTPHPIAFIHAAERPGLRDCFYICRAFENGWSVREAFTAFSRGVTHFQGKSDTELFGAIVRFLRTLHDRGVFFRDLSAGNLLFRCEAEAEIEFALIDTTRARFYPTAVGLRQRLGDLIRLCHPLHGEGREAFMGIYMQFLGTRFRLWMKIPFAYYDVKHWVKNTLKRL